MLTCNNFGQVTMVCIRNRADTFFGGGVGAVYIYTFTSFSILAPLNKELVFTVIVYLGCTLWKFFVFLGAGGRVEPIWVPQYICILIYSSIKLFLSFIYLVIYLCYLCNMLYFICDWSVVFIYFLFSGPWYIPLPNREYSWSLSFTLYLESHTISLFVCVVCYYL